MSALMAPDDVTNLVNRIHDRPAQLVLEFTGAGAVALAWLHSVGGSSRTVLEASDRYSPGALIDLIGYTPDRYTGLPTSKAMAGKALARARELAAELGEELREFHNGDLVAGVSQGLTWPSIEVLAARPDVGLLGRGGEPRAVEGDELRGRRADPADVQRLPRRPA